MSLTLTAVPHIPHVQAGDNISQLIIQAMAQANMPLQNGDILAIAQKIISKAEGRTVQLESVTPSPNALTWAEKTGKDPRLVELILQESVEVSRYRKGVMVVTHRLGFTSANAGIDRSNVEQQGASETVLLLPIDPDGSARAIQQTIQEQLGVQVGVVITDSHGRPFRLGTVGIAIGIAGLPAVWDRRGEPDLYGFQLQHTDVGLGDEIASAAGLLMGQANEGSPVVLLRGLTLAHIANGTAADLNRPKEMDLYR